MNKFPEYIIIGAHKAGTTALLFNLNRHPKIYNSSWDNISSAYEKVPIVTAEINFWNKYYNKRHIDKRINNGNIITIEDYKNLFKDKHDFVCGEKTPSYWLSSAAMQKIKHNIPNVKLILCIREPVARAYSHHQMGGVNGTIKDFQKLNGAGTFFDQGKYYKHLSKNVLPFFDKENVHVVVMEKMKQNLDVEINKVFKFLGVDEFHDNMIGEIEYTAKGIMRKYDGMSTWSSVTKNVPALSLEYVKKLKALYKNDNEKLFDYLGYEISEWA